MKKIEVCILFGLIMAVLTGNVAAFGQQCEEIRGNVLRLHILAHSDGEADQQLKLLVRDALLEELGTVLSEESGMEAAEETARDNLREIEEIARRILRENGCGYDVTATVVNMYFETRTYDGFTMPAGRYDALRIIIGEGAGKNWWCVMYPPLCIPAAADPEEAFTEGQLGVLEESPVYEPRFALVEFIEGLLHGSDEDSAAAESVE